jgi:hypothetical protein
MGNTVKQQGDYILHGAIQTISLSLGRMLKLNIQKEL